MRIKLFLLLLLTVAIPGLAQQTASLKGVVKDASTGAPVPGAAVMLNDRGVVVTTGSDGSFVIPNLASGNDVITIAAYGFNDLNQPVEIAIGNPGGGEFKLLASELGNVADAQQEMLFDQSVLEDEEGNAQSVDMLTGGSDNIFNNIAGYNFSLMRFRNRGYDSYLNTTYINGIPLNDLARGRFNYSSLGGMTSRMFRNRTTTTGMSAASYGFSSIGGSSNINTLTESYAPGFYGSVAYTNSSYMLRAMALYSTGINEKGWGVTVGGIGRYADEGVVPGTFYNSGGYFLSVEKQFNPKHSLTFTTFGAPTQRATSSATFLEAYELADDNLYNPNWGWYDGKKRSSKIVETYDPTFLFNWVWKPSQNTTVNTGFAMRWVNYSTSAFQWTNANDPKPDYYRNLPSFWVDDPEKYAFYTDAWRNESFRQIDWDALYQANYLNNYENAQNPNGPQKGSSYILENRHSNQENFIFNSYINHRLNSVMTLQGGATINYTRAHYYKTVRDLLGGEFWIDVDPFSDRDFPDDLVILQNNLLDPNRHVKEGDTFGYNYYVDAIQARAWLQNMITLPQWDIHYGLEVSYTQFQRQGMMKNGRAPENSLGYGKTHRFENGALKAGATYKINGRNAITLNAEYTSRAPLFEYSYLSPRVKDDAVEGLESSRIFSADLTYSWNYRRFRGQISGFYTNMYGLTERTSFYDDRYSTFMNYVMSGVRQNYMGIELGMDFKILPSLTLTAAGTIGSYRYKNNPTGVRSYENNTKPDVHTTVYLKNYHVGGTPQKAAYIGLNWQAPKRWFVTVSGVWMGDSYVNLSPIRHEALGDLWTMYPDQASLEQAVKDITAEEKLNNAFTLNASVGKIIYLNSKMSLNINVSVDNILNKKNIMTYGYQQGRFDYTDFNREKYANKYFFAQGIKAFVNVGLKF